jgi:hypothetical protein
MSQADSTHTTAIAAVQKCHAALMALPSISDAVEDVVLALEEMIAHVRDGGDAADRRDPDSAAQSWNDQLRKECV